MTLIIENRIYVDKDGFLKNSKQKILDKITNITNTFPDYYSIIKYQLKLEYLYENFTLFFNIVKNEFLEYEDILTKDFDTYLNKLLNVCDIALLIWQKMRKISIFCYVPQHSNCKGSQWILVEK